MRYQLELKPQYPVGSKLLRRSDSKVFMIKRAPDNVSWLGYLMSTNQFIDLIYVVTQNHHAKYTLKADDEEVLLDEEKITSNFDLLLL